MKLQRGFTLIETLIYLALFAVIIGGGLVVAYQVIESSGKNTDKVIVQEEANFLLRKIDWALTGVSVVTVISPTSLAVTKPDLPPLENPLIFDLTSGNLSLKRGTAGSINLNSSNVSIQPVAGVMFTDLPPTAGKPEGIKTSFIISGQTFETTKYFRK